MKKERRIENNFKLHNILSKSLIEGHCLAAFITLLDSGRELELKYKELPFSITRDGKSIVVSDGNIFHRYENAYELLLCAKIKNQYIIDIWDDIEIVVLF